MLLRDVNAPRAFLHPLGNPELIRKGRAPQQNGRNFSFESFNFHLKVNKCAIKSHRTITFSLSQLACFKIIFPIFAS